MLCLLGNLTSQSIGSVAGVTYSSIAAVSGVTSANIGAVSGISVPAGGSTPAFRSAAENYATTGTSLTITKPSGTASGDLLVAVIYFNGNSNTITPPSGWTSIGGFSTFSSGATSEWYYKIAGGSEPADYTWTGTSSNRNSGVVATFTGSFTGDPTDSGPNTNTSGPTNTGITTINSNVMVIYFGGYDEAAGGTWNEDTGWTSAGADSGATNTYIGYKLYATAGATGTISYSISGTLGAEYNSVWGFYSNN